MRLDLTTEGSGRRVVKVLIEGNGSRVLIKRGRADITSEIKDPDHTIGKYIKGTKK